ncbi:ABC transporter substrate-binding protein [Pseudonocardia sp. H11422]|uniref:ABC transporter substrate-binding protein n=1 Tax=Pseudonocardia sp. H11422 TaxID=2835866 RepID=UPI001BDBEB09|nr:ABC transporter substrate-binding protein [Pseudonocardia sp. H11422]
MSPTRHLAATVSLVALLVLTACGGPPERTATAGGEITEKNCGLDVTVAAPPQRIYAAYQPAVEMAHALGVSDRLVGTAFLDAAVLPEYTGAQARAPYVPKIPSREALLATNPDFVLSGFNDVFADGSGESFGTRASLRELGVQTWIFSPLCPSGDGLSDEAIDPATVTMDSVYTDVHDLGRLFGVEERAAAVVAEMQARIDAVRERVAGAPRPRVAVVSPREDGTFRIAGGPDFVTRILDIAGADNAFADLTSKRNIMVGVEEIIARDPDVILTSTCCDASYTVADAEPDAERIRTNPALANVAAVKNGQVQPFLFADRAAGVRVPYAAEQVAALVHPDRA